VCGCRRAAPLAGIGVKAHVGFRGVGLDHRTNAAMRAPSRALPRRRALCTN
jgi:hypothetical protein